MTETNKEDLKRVEQGLARNQLFTGLEAFYLKDLIVKAEVRTWPAGTQIITEGDPGDAVFFIISGRVKVTLYGEEGREIVLAILNDGDMFGEMSIIDDKPRSANVEAVSDLQCLVVTKNAFLEYMATHHKVNMRFLSYITGRLRDATRQIGGLALLDVCGRIAHTLLGMAKADLSGGKDVVAIERPTHEQLAAMIGSSREVVSRALKKMTQEGYIKIEKDRILLYVSE